MNSRLYAAVICMLVFFRCSFDAAGQKVQNLMALKYKPSYDNVASQTLNTDSTATSTLVWIKNDVRPHYHAMHTEHVLILEGEGQMLLGNQILHVRPNDLIYIPEGTVHAVRVVNKDKPLRVLSIHSPQFDGSDRVQVEKAGW